VSSDAHRITLDQIRDLLTGLGIEPDTNRLMTVFIEPGKVTVVRKRQDENGRYVLLLDHNEVATETTTIAVVGR
jgi:hypothetical protein